MWVKIEIDRIDREADRFAQTGKDVIAFFGEYQAAVGQRDVGRVLACIDPDYASDAEGTWSERLRSDRDGIRVYEWHPADPGPFTRRRRRPTVRVALRVQARDQREQVQAELDRAAD